MVEPASLCAILPGGINGGDHSIVSGSATTLNALEANDPALQNLTVDVANNGGLPSSVNVQASSGPTYATNPNPASSQWSDVPASNILNWNLADAAAAQANGELLNQVLFEEVDHYYYIHNSVLNSSQIPEVVTANIGGNSYTFTLWTPLNPTTSLNAFLGVLHLFSHNDIVDAYQNDSTNSVSEALQYSDQHLSPAAASQVQSQNRGKDFQLDAAGASAHVVPKNGATCKSSSAAPAFTRHPFPSPIPKTRGGWPILNGTISDY